MTKTNGPLKGIRIIEMEGLGPAPFCGMMLTDLGAEVIRIARATDSGLGLPMDQKFDILSRGRQSIALDLKQPEAIDLVLRLIEKSDGLIEGMRPGVMERLGLGPDVCFKNNEKLVYGRMTGWGQDGPMAQMAGHDINYISTNGVLGAIGDSDGPPIPPINLVGDYGGGAMFLMVGMLAALLEAKGSGKGQVVDAAMVDGSSYLLSTLHQLLAAGLWKDERGSNFLDGGAPYYHVYETADGRHMAVGAIEPKFYALLLHGLGLTAEDLPSRDNAKNWSDLTEIFATTFLQKTQDEWSDIFAGSDACVTPILSLLEAQQFEANRSRKGFVSSGECPVPAPAPRFSRTPAKVQGGAVLAGTHSMELLRDLDFSDNEIENFIARGIVYSALSDK